MEVLFVLRLSALFILVIAFLFVLLWYFQRECVIIIDNSRHLLTDHLSIRQKLF